MKKKLDLFFRQLSFENRDLRYSLLRNTWTKDYPLNRNQNVNAELIYDKLREMVINYNGEVWYMKKPAKAINNDNTLYKECMCFGFTNKAYQYTTILFTYEIYGKTLHITILTLFTPERNIDYDKVKEYALNIKNNSYFASFRESILQALDQSLKVKENIYEDINKKPVNNKKFFE
ncbi:MAG: hypothetical protein LUG12_10515 [Erysipelotrichaceae bacterium]|nr:hypothetical protein [Erysipelotrichaceae bacterium]